MEARARPVPCPVCEGKGAWYRHDPSKTVSPKHQETDPDILVCLMCRGNRTIVMPDFRPGGRY